MDVVIALLAFCVGVVLLVVWVVWLGERSARHFRRAAVDAVRGARWEVGEEASKHRAPGRQVTAVFARKVTAAGEELERIPVAEVPASAPDWDEQMIAARDRAAQRAAVMNEKP